MTVAIRRLLAKRTVLQLLLAPTIASIAVDARAQEVLIFGGDGHKEFLGCLTCNEYSGDSVWNDFSQHGWRNSFGTWNPFGQYKNPFSSYSACNEFASDPPVLVDRTGNYYGRLSVSQYKSGSMCSVSGNARICRATKVMCASD